MQVAWRFSAEQVMRCLNARGRTRDELPFIRLFMQLGPHVRALVHGLDVALEIALRMPEEYDAKRPARAMTLAALAPRLSRDQLSSCLEMIERGSVVLTQVFGLTALLPHREDLATSTRAQARGVSTSGSFHGRRLRGTGG